MLWKLIDNFKLSSVLTPVVFFKILLGLYWDTGLGLIIIMSCQMHFILSYCHLYSFLFFIKNSLNVKLFSDFLSIMFVYLFMQFFYDAVSTDVVMLR
jgi:hypothetical protein